MKNYHIFSLFLNDKKIGQIVFEDEKSAEDFQKAYETLPDNQKWGFAYLVMTDDK
jgi:hypothetical protein